MPAFLSRVAPFAEEAPDSATSVNSLPWQNRAPWSFAELFHYHYAGLRTVLDGSAGPGYVVTVIHHEDRMLGHGCVTLGDPEASHTIIVGRHERSDIRLVDPQIALRHLVLRITLGPERRPMVRVIDLHTGHGFVVEGVGACSSVRTDSDLAIRLGSYTLMFLPLPVDGRPWPETPEEALASRPRPVLRDCRLLPEALVDASEPSLTVLPGASLLGAACAEPRAGDVVATLTVVGPHGETVHRLTAAQLDSGVLVGRYPRCDVDGRGFAHAEALSRVHLLLLADGGDVVAVDVASTNGILINKLETRVGHLAAQCTIELGSGNVAHWRLTDAWQRRTPPVDRKLN